MSLADLEKKITNSKHKLANWNKKFAIRNHVDYKWANEYED